VFQGQSRVESKPCAESKLCTDHTVCPSHHFLQRPLRTFHTAYCYVPQPLYIAPCYSRCILLHTTGAACCSIIQTLRIAPYYRRCGMLYTTAAACCSILQPLRVAPYYSRCASQMSRKITHPRNRLQSGWTRSGQGLPCERGAAPLC